MALGNYKEPSSIISVHWLNFKGTLRTREGKEHTDLIGELESHGLSSTIFLFSPELLPKPFGSHLMRLLAGLGQTSQEHLYHESAEGPCVVRGVGRKLPSLLQGRVV